MKIVFLGLTISSTWGNGHATTYRNLLRELGELGHEVYFLEHNKPWYESTRDFYKAESYFLELYQSFSELKNNYKDLVQSANMVVVGSFISDGIQVADWVLENSSGITAFYDIDTPLTFQKLEKGNVAYISREQIPCFDLYLSFAGGEILKIIEEEYGAKMAKPLYCSIDPGVFYPIDLEKKWTLGYFGSHSDDKQAVLDDLMLATANKIKEKDFVIVGPGYLKHKKWPDNIIWINHLPAHQKREFYCSQRFTLNVTRSGFENFGFSPSVRLFEAAACGVPIISDYWEGLSELFTEGKEIFVSRSTQDTIEILKNTSEEEIQKVGEAAREKILNHHTAIHRALELISYYMEIKLRKKYYEKHFLFTNISGN